MDGVSLRAHASRRVPAVAAALVLAYAAVASAPAHAGIGLPGGCITAVVRGLDVSLADGTRFIRLTHGLAQTFDAPDTLVSTVSVWLPASRLQLTIPLHLRLVATDGDGRPDPDAVIADGGSMDRGRADGPDAARFTYEFDPPVMLPSPGRYALVLVPDVCNAIPVMVDDADDYPDGELWELAQRQCGQRLTSVSDHFGGTDLAFRVEFCEGGTATTGRTWGELKTRYR